MSAKVLLGGKLVGHLTPQPERRAVVFGFEPTYAADPRRHILSRQFEDGALDQPFDGQPLPSYFRNLLPEGALRKMIEARLGQSRLLEYAMLLRLGRDLPGNIVVEGDDLASDELSVAEMSRRVGRDPFRFSLSGVQPKTVVLENEDRFSVPVHGQLGEWVAKFSSPAFQGAAENEYAMLRWASECGLDVPDHRLIRANEIHDLPRNFAKDQRVLIVRRFDRTSTGRVHHEDFAQVLGLEPEDKYKAVLPDWVHYGSIGRIVHALAGGAAFFEYVRRLAFMILCGNMDGHIKNWALIYPDGIHAELAPLYDYVATIVYGSLDRNLALGWLPAPDPWHDPPRPATHIEHEDFRALARFVGTSEDAVERECRSFVTKAREIWASKVRVDVPDLVRGAVDDHLSALRLD